MTSSSIRQLAPGHRWPTGRAFYIGQFADAPLEDLAQRTGLVIQRFVEDGLGPGASAGAILPSGLGVVLTEYEHLIEHRGMTGPQLEADAYDVVTRGAAPIFAEALVAFGLTRDHVAHEPTGDTAGEAATLLEQARHSRPASSSADEA